MNASVFGNSPRENCVNRFDAHYRRIELSVVHRIGLKVATCHEAKLETICSIMGCGAPTHSSSPIHSGETRQHRDGVSLSQEASTEKGEEKELASR